MEDECVVHHSVHEVAVVADDDETSAERLEIFFQNLHGDDVQVVRRLVEDEEVGSFHQHGAEIESSSLASAELVYVAVLLFRFEEEMLEEL